MCSRICKMIFTTFLDLFAFNSDSLFYKDYKSHNSCVDFIDSFQIILAVYVASWPSDQGIDLINADIQACQASSIPIYLSQNQAYTNRQQQISVIISEHRNYRKKVRLLSNIDH